MDFPLHQTARPVLYDPAEVNQMIEDIEKIDLNSIVSQALCASLDQHDQDNALSADREWTQMLPKLMLLSCFEAGNADPCEPTCFHMF